MVRSSRTCDLVFDPEIKKTRKRNRKKNKKSCGEGSQPPEDEKQKAGKSST